MRRQRIVVIGAGIAGLVAARVLQRQRFCCTLVEPRADLAGGGAGLMLWPSALRALTRLGYRDVLDLGAPVHESIVRDTNGRTLLRIPLGTRQDSQPRATPRQSLMHLLRRDLQCDLVPLACTGIRRAGAGFAVELTDAPALAADGVLVAT
ncbi:MAG TPA: NAD(P)-binding protein, partial [Planctomycetota bacterium]